MIKEQLLNLSEEFMQEAFTANCYYEIIKQFSVNAKEYYVEIGYSSAFYTYVYNALIVATFMELSKIYDTHKKSFNIFQLINICKTHLSLFPQKHKIELNNGDRDPVMEFPYKHKVSSAEEQFFEKEIETQNTYNKLLNVTDIPIYVEMTLDRYFDLYYWKYNRIEPQVRKLLNQRNKVYAHNDIESLLNIEDVISAFPLNRNDIESLISFAVEFCQFIIVLLTGVNRANKPINISDWEATLHLVRLGYKYKDVEVGPNTIDMSKITY